MKTVWLVDLLADGTVLDNQNYHIREGVIDNQRLSSGPILVQSKPPGSKRTRPEHYGDAIWNFLLTINTDVKSALESSSESQLLLFNSKEYEHNTEDGFLDVYGVDCENFQMQTGNLIGFIKRGDYALKIDSRFGQKFLKFIIADADGFVELNNYGGVREESEYEWLLVYLWKIKLKKAFRLGIPKEYVSKQERLVKPRGNIDVIDYFSRKTEASYLCKYREHSFDNPATRLISETFRKLNAGKHRDLISDVGALRNAFTTASEGVRLRGQDINQVKHLRNLFYSDYNEVIDLSKRILKDELSNFGSTSETSAFLFDVSMLFEYFVRKALLRSGFNLNGKFTDEYKIPAGSLHGYKRKLEPDLIISNDVGTYVFDVKYKTYDFKYGVKREDLFQLHTYVSGVGNDSDVIGGGFIYPISENNWENNGLGKRNGIISEDWQFLRTSKKLFVVFIKIPTSETLNFSESFRNNIRFFTNQFKQALQ
ncbi:restriction endonuclease [Bacteroidota bacterium]